MQEYIEIRGLKELLKSLENAGQAAYYGLYAGLDYGLRKTSEHIKTHYVFSITGKGFDDQTANLRNSINFFVTKKTDSVVGLIGSFGGNLEYAKWVETRWEGRHAYLYPGVKDNEQQIMESVKDAIEAAIKKI